MTSDNRHGVVVSAWAARFDPGSSPPLIVDAFNQAYTRLWRRADETLGDVTLRAISDRVLYTAARRFPMLEAVRTGPEGLQLEVLRERADGLDGAELLETAQFVLMEFLTVLGKLTAEILTPALHAELANLAPERAVRAEDEAS